MMMMMMMMMMINFESMFNKEILRYLQFWNTSLLFQFLNVPLFRNITLKCLTEIGELPCNYTAIVKSQLSLDHCSNGSWW